MTTFRELARNRDFTVLWAGQTISELGSRVSTFAYPLLGYLLTRSPMWAALVEAAYFAGIVAMLLPAGVLADRIDRRRLMRLSSGAGFALYGSLVLAGAMHALTIGHLLAVALLTGVTTGLFTPAEAAAVRTVVRPEDLPTAFSQQQAREHLASLVGTPLGGVLLTAARWLPFLFDAISYAACWLFLGRIRADLAPEPRAGDGPARPFAEVRDGLGYVRRQPFMRVLLVWSPLVNLTVNALFLLAILRLVQGGSTPPVIAVVEVVGGVCGILGALAAPRLIDRLPTGRLTLLVVWSMVPLMVPMALWNTPAVVAAAAGVILLLNPAGNAGIGSYRTVVTPPELLGRVQAAMQVVSYATMPLAPLLAGGLLAWLGGRDAMLALGVLTGLVALIPTLSRSVRSVPRPAEWLAAGGAVTAA